MAHRIWTRDELLVTFNFYCRTPFGLFHSRNPDVIQLGEKLGRTPSAVAMKLCNFASFDPSHQARAVSGLSNTSRADKEIWEAFNQNSEDLAFESQQAFSRLMHIPKPSPKPLTEEIDVPKGPTEASRQVRVRLVQSFFRETVLSSYRYRCAVCEMNVTELLTASHIIPWSHNTERRADPRNGLSLCALHDRAFDRGFIALDEEFQVMLSQKLHRVEITPFERAAFLDFEQKPILQPQRFAPDPQALLYHRQNIFKAGPALSED